MLEQPPVPSMRRNYDCCACSGVKVRWLKWGRGLEELLNEVTGSIGGAVGGTGIPARMAGSGRGMFAGGMGAIPPIKS